MCAEKSGIQPEFLSTFCVINEYRENGFAHLHRMIASAKPLVLWAPSSVLLNKYYATGACQINTNDFLWYVENGYVQIMGRQKWLLDPAWRNRKAKVFEVYKWMETVDATENRPFAFYLYTTGQTRRVL